MNSIKSRTAHPSLLPGKVLSWLAYMDKYPVWRNIKEFYYTSMYPVLLQRVFVGQDDHGNRYYETKNSSTATHCRNRFVIYKDLTNYDASDVSADWHGWLHKVIDVPPVATSTPESTLYKPSRGYQGHPPNWTGTTGKYVPYSTTKPKIQSWGA